LTSLPPRRPSVSPPPPLPAAQSGPGPPRGRPLVTRGGGLVVNWTSPPGLSLSPMESTPGIVATPPAGRPAVLVTLAHAIVVHSDPASLLRDLVAALRDHLWIEYLSFALLDPAAGSAKLQLLEPVDPTRAPNPADTPTQLPSGESPTAIVWESQEPLWLDVASAGGRLPTL